MSLLKPLLAATTALVLVASAGSAHATSYSFASISFSNLSLTGLQSSGVTVESANVATRDSANYPGYTSAANSAGATVPSAPLTAGSNVAQAYSGPGPAPAEDTYTQALLSGIGTRGDARIVGNLLTGVGTGANDVAEGRLVVPGDASSTAGTSTGFNVTITNANRTTFTLSFDASDMLSSTTTAANEFASAQINASFSVVGNGATANTFTSQFYAPNALNANVSSTGGGANGAFSSGSPDPVFYTFSVTLDPGTYQFSLLSGAQEEVSAPNVVPEPMSLALFGGGLVAIGLLRRNRAI